MPISPDSSYCLLGAMDCLDLTTDIVVGAYAAEVDVDAIIDRGDNDATRGFADAVTTEVLNWRSNTGGYEKAIMAVAAMLESAAPMREFLWGITGPIAEAYLFRKGYPQRRNIHNDLISRLELNVDIPNIQSLRKPYVVHALLESDPASRSYGGMLRQQYDRTLEGLTDIPVEDYARRMSVRVAERRRQRAELVGAARQEISLAVSKKPDRRDVHRIRKSIRRGIKAMNQIVANDAFTGFISKDGFVINGCLFDYHVSKTKNLLDLPSPESRHIPYGLQIRNKSGEPLGIGCIIFPNVPVLDQVIALTLHVRDREAELDLIKTANWRLTEAASEDPVFSKIRPPDISASALRGILGGLNDRFYHHRKSIMRCIEQDVLRTVSDILGIPLPVLSFMADPQTRPEYPLIDTTVQFSSALLAIP